MKPRLLAQILTAGVLLACMAFAGPQTNPVLPRSEAEITGSVRHALLTYPYYGIFDDLSYKVQNSQVTLYGYVTQPWKDSDIKNIVSRLPGVESVNDQIKVLPLSDNDNLLRRQIAAAIYRYPALSRYGMGTHPSIHIIVDNGRVTLTGMVDSQADKDLAGIRAASAGLSFGPIVNNLQVAPRPGT